MLDRLKHTGVRLRDWAYTLPAPPVLRGTAEFVGRVIRNYGRHDGPHAAAGIAYYSLFSLFPLVLGTLAIASLFIGTQEAQQRLMDFLSEQVPGLAEGDLLQENIQGVVQARGLLGVISVITLLWAGRAVFIALRRISNRAWEVTELPHFLMTQVSNFLSTLGIAALFLASLFAGTAGRVIERQTEFIDRLLPVDVPIGLLFALVPFLMSLLVFLAVYKFVPDTKVAWREAFAGALIAAALFELLKFGFSIYLQEFANYEQVYGNLSTVMVVLFGLFLVAQIFVIGAEVSSEYGRSRQQGIMRIGGRLMPVRGGLAPRWRREQAVARRLRKHAKGAARSR